MVADDQTFHDGSALAALPTPTTEWVIRGEGELAGTYTGPDEIFRFWKARRRRERRWSPAGAPRRARHDERAMALVQVTSRRGDRDLDEARIVVFELADGTITRGTFVYERPEVYDAFWS